MILRIILPLPSMDGSNGRGHWRTRHRKSQTDLSVARDAALLEPPLRHLSKSVVIVDWYCANRRLIDTDNALSRLKGYIDGLTQAGWWKDDRDIWRTIISRYTPDQHLGLTGRVMITAIEMPPNTLRSPEIDCSLRPPEIPPDTRSSILGHPAASD